MTDAGSPVLELGTGFRDDEVTVWLDGAPVWHGRGVTTDYSVGLAAVVTLPPGASGTLEVRVGARASGSAQLAATGNRSGLRADLDPAGAMTVAPAPGGPIY